MHEEVLSRVYACKQFLIDELIRLLVILGVHYRITTSDNHTVIIECNKARKKDEIRERMAKLVKANDNKDCSMMKAKSANTVDIDDEELELSATSQILARQPSVPIPSLPNNFFGNGLREQLEAEQSARLQAMFPDDDEDTDLPYVIHHDSKLRRDGSWRLLDCDTRSVRTADDALSAKLISESSGIKGSMKIALNSCDSGALMDVLLDPQTMAFNSLAKAITTASSSKVINGNNEQQLLNAILQQGAEGPSRSEINSPTAQTGSNEDQSTTNVASTCDCDMKIVFRCKSTFWSNDNSNLGHSSGCDCMDVPKLLSPEEIYLLYNDPVKVINEATIDEISENISKQGFFVFTQEAIKKAKAKAHKKDGDIDETFHYLRSFVYSYRDAHKNSWCDYDATKKDNRFRRLFMSLGPWLKSYENGTRLLFVDSARLSSYHQGTMTLATSIDCNRKTFVVAVGISEAENNDCYDYFFRNLRIAISKDIKNSQIIFMSDRQASIHTNILKYFCSPKVPQAANATSINTDATTVAIASKDTSSHSTASTVAVTPSNDTVDTTALTTSTTSSATGSIASTATIITSVDIAATNTVVPTTAAATSATARAKGNKSIAAVKTSSSAKDNKTAKTSKGKSKAAATSNAVNTITNSTVATTSLDESVAKTSAVTPLSACNPQTLTSPKAYSLSMATDQAGPLSGLFSLAQASRLEQHGGDFESADMCASNGPQLLTRPLNDLLPSTIGIANNSHGIASASILSTTSSVATRQDVHTSSNIDKYLSGTPLRLTLRIGPHSVVVGQSNASSTVSNPSNTIANDSPGVRVLVNAGPRSSDGLLSTVDLHTQDTAKVNATSVTSVNPFKRRKGADKQVIQVPSSLHTQLEDVDLFTGSIVDEPQQQESVALVSAEEEKEELAYGDVPLYDDDDNEEDNDQLLPVEDEDTDNEEMDCAKHLYCAVHLLKNLELHCRTFNDRVLFYNLVRSCNPKEFEYHWKVLSAKYPKAAEYLSKIDPKQWAMAKHQYRTYGHITNNPVECVNSALLAQRIRPILYLLESIIARSAVYHNEIAKHIRTKDGLTVGAYCRLKTNQSVSNGYHVQRDYQGGFIASKQANNPGKTESCVVKVRHFKCDCGYYQVYGLPCRHALAVIRQQMQTQVTDVGMTNYCDVIFTRRMYQETYYQKVIILPISSLVYNPNDKPPAFTSKRPGAPQKKRKKSIVEIFRHKFEVQIIQLNQAFEKSLIGVLNK